MNYLLIDITHNSFMSDQNLKKHITWSKENLNICYSEIYRSPDNHFDLYGHTYFDCNVLSIILTFWWGKMCGTTHNLLKEAQWILYLTSKVPIMFEFFCYKFYQFLFIDWFYDQFVAFDNIFSPDCHSYVFKSFWLSNK